jgi:hypothetical protein
MPRGLRHPVLFIFVLIMAVVASAIYLIMVDAQRRIIKLVGREASRNSEGLYEYRPLSKWNLEPTQGVADDFQRWGWRRLESQDEDEPLAPIQWQPAWRFERVGEVMTLRYMRADPASAAACVNCHNQYEREPDTVLRRVATGTEPGKQWKQHQLLGAIEVSIPVDRVEALAALQTRQRHATPKRSRACSARAA